MSRALSVFVLFAYVFVSCTTWKDPGRPVVETVTEKRPSEVYTTLRDGQSMAIQRPRVEGDSLIGVSGRPPDTRRVAFATSDVTRVEVNEFSGSRTTLLVLGIGAAAFLVLLIGLRDIGPDEDDGPLFPEGPLFPSTN